MDRVVIWAFVSFLLVNVCSVVMADVQVEGREMFKALHDEQMMPMPTSYPVYHFGATADMPATCRLNSLTAACYDRGEVWLAEPLRLMSERDRLPVILHENVHHLDWEKKGDAKNCQQNWEREVRAYRAQQIYIVEHFGKRVSFALDVCPPEQGGPKL